MIGLSDLRATLTAALNLAGVQVYPFPAQVISPPAIVIVPDDPYLVPVGIGRDVNLRVRFRVFCAVANLDNSGALDKLEDLAVHLHTNLPAGTVVGDTSRPGVTSVGPSELLTTETPIEVAVSATAEE